MDMQVTVTLLRRKKHGREKRKNEGAEAIMGKGVDEGSVELKLTKRKGALRAIAGRLQSELLGQNNKVTKDVLGMFFLLC